MLPKYGNAQNTCKLTGSVINSNAKPLPIVTVQLFKQNNLQKPINTTLTNDNGLFQFNIKDTENYLLDFKHTGFAEIKKEIKVKQLSDLQIEPIKMVNSIGMLKEVVVQSSKNLIEQADDKTVFNVENDPTNKTETALDILRKTPFVSVDGDDNIKVNGNDNFKVLLNGRETSMFAKNIKDALRGFPGSIISKIEVITNPSAKYDAEGVAGIINIITKKKVAGYNGTVSTFSRTSDNLNSFSVNGNGKFGKIGVSLFFHTGNINSVPQHSINTTIPTVATAFSERTLAGDSYNDNGWSYGNAEVSWEIDTLNTLSVYSNINSSSDGAISGQTITTNFLSDPSTISYYDLNNTDNNPGVSVGTDFIKKFRKNKEHELSVQFFGEFGKANSLANSTQTYQGDSTFLLNNSNSINDQYTIQADNSVPLKRNQKIEMGVKAILRRASSNFESQEKYDPQTPYKLDPANTGNFNYAQDVLSAYTTYSFKVKKSNFRIGLRAEYTNINGNFSSSDTSIKSNYISLLPNFLFSHKLSDVTTFTINYNERLSRPYITDLNPFVFNNDSLNITYGNPGLGPQTVHNLSFQVRYSKGNTFADVSLEGSYSDNKILQYSSFDAQTGVTKTTSFNIGKELLSNLNVDLDTKITAKWDLFINSSLRFSSVTNILNKAISNNGFGGNFFVDTRYDFTKKFAISSFIGFWRDPITIETTYPFWTWYNFALNYKIFKEKFSISLRTVNFFEKTHDYITIIKDPDFTTTNINTQIRRGAVLALTYNFGKLTESVSKKKGVNNDDLLSKPQATSVN